MQNRGLVFLSLFGSLSTLICCALPALFVALGMGAVVAGVVSSFPALVVLSENKEWVFAGSFFMLGLSSIFLYRARNLPCPIDPAQRWACETGRKISIWILFISYLLWGIGALVAFFPALIYQILP